MARSTSPPLLSELRNAESAVAVNHALRKLKNEIIGHGQKKQQWIEDGILKFLVRILGFSDGIGHLALHASANRPIEDGAISRREEEEAMLQAMIVIGSLADGGPAFVPPIYASDALLSLFRLLDPNVSSSRIILQSLRTLNKVAEALTLAAPEHSLDGCFIRALYNHDTLRNIAILITEENVFGPSKPQVELIALLISKTCHEEYQRNLLDQCFVLDAFAGQLNTWIESSFVPQVEQLCVQWEPRLTVRDDTASDLLRHASVLHAIGAIILFSTARAQRLLSTCSSIFEHMDEKFHTAWASTTKSLPAHVKVRVPGPPTCADCLLPKTPSAPSIAQHSHTSGHPPYDPIKTIERPGGRGSSSAIELFSSHGLERVSHNESTLIPWLIHMSRTSDELISISAMALLGTLHQLKLTGKIREASIALLLLPSLVQMLDKTFLLPKRTRAIAQTGALTLLVDHIKADAPAILATITINNPKTQKAAFDAGAIKNLSQLLKQSYDPINAEASHPLWSPESDSNTRKVSEDESRRIGPSGISPAARHVMRVRETTMVALAALASTKDEYRKAIVENGLVPFAVRALKAEQVKFASSKSSSDMEEASIEDKIAKHCCREAVIAACGLMRALSRSVATLRTSMVEAGLLPPLFALLRCNDMILKTQATAVVCNLALEFSPLKEAVLEDGIHKLLCEHAHSKDPGLRLNALWAIKHLVAGTSLEYRLTILDSLGITWLKSLMSNEPETATPPSRNDDGATTPMRMSTPNAAGETVDLLNAVDTSSRASSIGPDLADPDTLMADTNKSDDSPPTVASSSRPRPTRFRQSHNNNNDNHLVISTSTDETTILQQSLEIIQNIVLGPSETKIITHILTAFGREDFFRILLSKLRPSPHSSSSPTIRRPYSIQSTNPDIVHVVVQILVNISASKPHKMLIMSHHRLLEALMACLDHKEPRIRNAVLWMLINLTWDEDANEQIEARERTTALMKMGWYERIRAMSEDGSAGGRGEEDLNCRERSRNVLQQMTSTLR